MTAERTANGQTEFFVGRKTQLWRCLQLSSGKLELRNVRMRTS